MVTQSHSYAFLAPITITINANQTNFVLATYLSNNNFWDGSSAFSGTVIIANGTDIYSTNTGVAGFNVGNFPGGATLTIINGGNIFGQGGQTPGTAGGNAFLTTIPITLDNTGRILAGGGAGGKGGSAGGGILEEQCDEDGQNCADVCAGKVSGAAGTGGSGGTWMNESGTAGGSGGSQTQGACSATGGNGGNGGAVGVAGTKGTAGVKSGCNCDTSAFSGQAGGASGYAIDGYSLITFKNTGTITGPTIN